MMWMGAWWAAFWTPEDVPALRTVVRLYDQVERGEYQRPSELRLQMDNDGASVACISGCVAVDGVARADARSVGVRF
jgi:hypothetical protein